MQFYRHCGKRQPHCNGSCYNHWILLADFVLEILRQMLFQPYIVLFVLQMES